MLQELGSINQLCLNQLRAGLRNGELSGETEPSSPPPNNSDSAGNRNNAGVVGRVTGDVPGMHLSYV